MILKRNTKIDYAKLNNLSMLEESTWFISVTQLKHSDKTT
jgi:hypothetical protein